MTISLMQAEVDFLGQLHHPNLVKLIGYCIEDDQRLLVYEFMTRGSLENHLFRSECDYFLVVLTSSLEVLWYEMLFGSRYQLKIGVRILFLHSGEICEFINLSIRPHSC